MNQIYPNFAKHCANLWQVKQRIQDKVSHLEGNDNIHLIDGFPIPVCHYGRAYRHKDYQDHAAFSYCAAKQEKYYGFEGPLLINLSGSACQFCFAMRLGLTINQLAIRMAIGTG